MSRDDILLEAEMSMEKSVDYLVHEFSGVRTGKASPALVENIDVQAYGSTMKLKQLALITTPESGIIRRTAERIGEVVRKNGGGSARSRPEQSAHGSRRSKKTQNWQRD